MALARAEALTFSYPDGARPALDRVSLALEPEEFVLCLGPSGSGKSTLLRAFAGLVPHFHGGSFAGRVEVGGLDTRRHRPAELAGTVASLFQDPEDQIVLTRVGSEVAFGLENLGTPPALIEARAAAALAAVGAEHLLERRTPELSGGELQRICLASALALRPSLLLLDEPTSQLDPDGAEAFFDLLEELDCAVLCSEQRPARPLERAGRVLFLERGRILLDAPREEALEWLAEHRPAYLPLEPEHRQVTDSYSENEASGLELVCRLEGAAYAYRGGRGAGPADLELRRGEIVALAGPNGSGKTTLAKLACRLLEPSAGTVELRGRAAYLSQDPGRYLVRERADEEVALGADLRRARHALAAVGLAGYEARHPRDLSSGERERLALACVLVTAPDLLVLDEPTRGVDPARKLELASLLRAQAHERATLVVTHDLPFAHAVADRTVSLAPAEERVLA